MGKSLIIKEVNFSLSNIEPEIDKIDFIGLSSFKDKHISSGEKASSGIRMAITFETDNEPHDNVILPGSHYNRVSAIYPCLFSNRVEVTFGSYGNIASLCENKRSIGLNLWDGEEHTIDFCKDWIRIDNSEYLWNYTPNEGSWDADIYLDSASIKKDSLNKRTNTYLSATKDTQSQLGELLVPDCVKLKRIKIWNNSVLEIDAIPAKVKENGEVCFHNLVNNTNMYTNDGSVPYHKI